MYSKLLVGSQSLLPLQEYLCFLAVRGMSGMLINSSCRAEAPEKFRRYQKYRGMQIVLLMWLSMARNIVIISYSP